MKGGVYFFIILFRRLISPSKSFDYFSMPRGVCGSLNQDNYCR